MTTDHLSWTLEQENSGINFADWMVQDYPRKQDLRLGSKTTKILEKIWIKTKGMLIPPGSKDCKSSQI